MGDLIYISSNSWLYLTMSIILLILLIKYRVEFNVKNLIEYFVYLTNKFNIIILFMTFLFMFIFSIADFSNEKIINFFKEVVIGLVFYSFFSYSIFFGILLIPKVQKFFKDNDLFTYSLYSKGGVIGSKGVVKK